MFFVCMFNGSIKTKHKVLRSITGKINKFYGKTGLGKKGFSSSVVCQITSGNDQELLLETSFGAAAEIIVYIGLSHRQPKTDP